jgi:hypothetical protein
MPTDTTYQPGVYRSSGGNKLVVGALGRISSAAGVGAQIPTTGTLSAHTTSATLTGNDFAGTISIVTDGTGTAANVDLFVVTFATVRTTAPVVILTNLSPGAGSASTYPGSYGAKSTTAGFTVEALSAVTLSSTVVLGYLVIDIE